MVTTVTMKNMFTAALLALTALPSTSALSYITSDNIADFNDRPDTSPVALYRSLHWHNFAVTQPHPNATSDATGGLYPKAHLSDDMLPASPLACHNTLSSALFGPARMSASYFGSNVSLFDLERFSFGCVALDPVTQLAEVTKPRSCVLGVRGYPPGRGINIDTGAQDLRGVKPSMEMTLWFQTPERSEGEGDGGKQEEEDEEEEEKVRMVSMESLNRSWWALGAVTFEALSNEGPVALCMDDFQYRTYSVTSWGYPGKGIQELIHDEKPMQRV